MKQDFTFLKRIVHCLIILILGIILMGGSCYEIKRIDQPSEVLAKDSFIVKIDLVPDGSIEWFGWGEDLTGNGIIGILLQDGWTVKDSVKYSIIHSEASETGEYYPEGFLIYNSEVVSFLNNYKDITAPEGYHWWGAKSNYRVDINYLVKASVNITIQTNNQIGEFNMTYVFGDNSYYNGGNSYCIVTNNEFNPIIISPTSQAVTSRENEEWELYPNPSKGQVYIRQGNISDEVLMKVYGLNGRLQKSDILREKLSYVDLSALSKGVYIVSLENHGEVKTKRLIIQ